MSFAMVNAIAGVFIVYCAFFSACRFVLRGSFLNSLLWPLTLPIYAVAMSVISLSDWFYERNGGKR